MHAHPQARRGLRAFAAATAVALTLGAAGVAAAAPVPPAPAAATSSRQDVARWGAGWLAREITAGGGHLSAFGAPDPADTAYAVVGLHAAGVGRAAANRAVAYLKTQLGDAVQLGGSDAPGRLAYWILAATASGENPRAFGGHAAKNNLVARLLATARTSGPGAGLFGAQDPTFDGAFRQGFALVALKAAGVPASNAKVAKAISWLERQQCANGLWEPYRTDTSVACVPADPITFAGPDTNSSGAAVQALAAYGARPRKAHVLASFHGVQTADGGFPYIAAAGQSSDPSSTALVIQALIALGAGPGSASWAVGGHTPYDALAAFQLGCAAPRADRGAFVFPGSSDPSVLSTVQAVPAAAGAALPVPGRHCRPAVPKQSCS